MKRLPAIIALLILCVLPTAAQLPRIFFVNAYPGNEIYQLEGHSALVVDFGHRGEALAFNYGVFDFNSPNFVYRFVKGETDYMLAAYPFRYFIDEYRQEGRRLVAHELDLDSVQTMRLVKLLMENVRPENCTYRYNYVKDNCATRPLRAVEMAAGDSIILGPAPFEAQSLHLPTFRNIMRHYHANYPWYQFGIDIALGSGIDSAINRRDMAFAPAELDAMLQAATINGHRLVKEKKVLVDVPSDAAIESPTPWYLSPMTVACLVFIAAVMLCIRDFRRHRVTRWFDATLFGIYGFAGLLLTFLIFVSVHEATSPNWLYIWLNPLCLLVPILIYNKKSANFLRVYQCIYGGAVLLLLIVWPLTPQSANAAFFPLMGAAIVRAASYAFIKPKQYIKR